jgi:hypothetical protein
VYFSKPVKNASTMHALVGTLHTTKGRRTMSWNYRLFKQDTPKAADGKHIWFVGECYYNEDGTPHLHSTMEHNHVCGNNRKETKEVYQMMSEAFEREAIELDEEGNFK